MVFGESMKVHYFTLFKLFTSKVDYIFILKAPAVTLNPSPNEVMSVKYVSKEELKDLFATAGIFYSFPTLQNSPSQTTRDSKSRPGSS